MARPDESTFVKSFRDTPRSVDQSAPRPTRYIRCNVPDCASPTVSPPLATNQLIPPGSGPPSLYSPHISFSLVTTPRNKSKLSIMSPDTSDTDTNAIDSLCSSRESSSDELDALPQKSSSPKPTVSRLSFPFVKSAKSPPSRRAVTSASSRIPPTGPQLPSTSGQDLKSQNTLSQPPPSSPSPFSPPVNNLQRPSYCHRGYSRQALAHIKWFWATREDKWDEKPGATRKNRLPLDISFLETALDDPLSSPLRSATQKRRAPVHPTCQSSHGPPPMTIHPRRGDLSTLHDPYCTQVDRSFVDLPTWTIGKMLWMHDIHLASQSRDHPGIEILDFSDAYDETESETESPGTTASSIIFSDDSDMTLVDSETESESSPGVSTTLLSQDFGGKRSAPSHDSFVSLSLQDGKITYVSRDNNLHLATLYKPNWSRFIYPDPPAYSPSCGSRKHSGQPMVGRPMWPKDWHRRWECMMEVAHRDQLTKRKARFFIGDRSPP